MPEARLQQSTRAYKDPFTPATSGLVGSCGVKCKIFRRDPIALVREAGGGCLSVGVMSASPAGDGADGCGHGSRIAIAVAAPVRPSGAWFWVLRCSWVVVVIATGWLLAEHMRGRRKLERVVADHGIRRTPGVQRWGPRRPLPPDSRFLQAAWIAHSLESVRTEVPPVLVQVGAGEALPMSEIDCQPLWNGSGPDAPVRPHAENLRIAHETPDRSGATMIRADWSAS